MSPEVYRQRRIGAGAVLIAALLLSITGCRTAVGWITGSDASAATPSHPGTTAVTCPADTPGTSTDARVPADLRRQLDALLASPAIAARQVSISIWVDGWGEVVAHDPDLRLKPASNQKIMTAIGALALLPSDERLPTTLVSTAPVENGRIEGDLVLVGGGDPTLSDVGSHSIYQMAADLRDLGVHEVTGRLYVDDSRYDGRRRAPGWTNRQIPGDASPISALTVKGNQLGDDAAYLADPAVGNGRAFLRYLADAGVEVRGGLDPNRPPHAPQILVRLWSPTIPQIVHEMLKSSDNTAAELLVKEVGRTVEHDGSTLAGFRAIHRLLTGWCIHLSGRDDDGSGLSYGNARSAREWREILQAAQRQPWWSVFRDGLPVAGEDGTLRGRLRDPATDGNVRAKTGTIDVSRALSGVFTTAGGRHATFSIIINSPDPAPAIVPTDQLVEAIAAEGA